MQEAVDGGGHALILGFQIVRPQRHSMATQPPTHGMSMGSVTAFRRPNFTGLFDGYDDSGYFCELTSPTRADVLSPLVQRLARMGLSDLTERSTIAERELFNLGITFTVYSEKDQIDRILPFDVLPRVVTNRDWQVLSKGLIQRIKALNLFLWDIYHDQHVLADKILPAELVLTNPNYRPMMQGFDPPFGTYIHIAGTDIIRGKTGEILVLEDNGRTPSGVSYVVENRHLMQRSFPDLLADLPIMPVSNYGEMLKKKLIETAPRQVLDPQLVLLSPGIFNSAYFEHVFLAREMGVPLVEGRDLTVENDRVFMKTIAGYEPVHVIYRRLNDEFLDPQVFNPDSVLGVPGLVGAMRKGTVSLANAIGTGVADDKAVYAYVPRLIRYYLNEEPILANVETHICGEPEGLKYTLANLDKLVVKPVGESGGYGITVGPKSTQIELDGCRKRLLANPAEFISQPMIELSVCPTLTPEGVQPRHIDLRPFIVTGRETWVLPGGLTRVALKKGSIIVNSSQGGGTKDTWVLADDQL